MRGKVEPGLILLILSVIVLLTLVNAAPELQFDFGTVRACMQRANKEFGPSSEDCLFLTVYSPPVSTATKKVMVYVPGGGFTEGGHRTYVPGSMVTENDVIVVITQYRLGALGWISSGDDVLPGNLGLRDQLLAISWVKSNIARFGGDPDDITLFGLSAGGISVSALALSPLAKGLFNSNGENCRRESEKLPKRPRRTTETRKALSQVIAQSGSAASKLAINPNPREYLYRFAEQAGCKPRFFFPPLARQYHQNILDCLMRKDASELIFGMNPFSDSDPDAGNIFSTGLLYAAGFSPVVDGEVLPRTVKSMLADESYLRSNGVLDRPYIIGVTNNDAGLLADIVTFIPGRPYYLLTVPSNVARRVRAAAETQFRGTPSTEMLNVIDFAYTYPRNPDGSIPLQRVMDMTLDGLFLIPSMLYTRALADKVPVYFYLFDHYPQLKDPNSQFKGTSHAMDNLYLFDRPADPDLNLSFYANVYTAESEPVPAVYRGALSSFAKTGSPTFLTSTSPNSFGTWPRYDLQSQKYLAISAKPEVRREVYAQRVSLWLDFLPKLARNSFFSFSSDRAAYA
ncbi:hypothetical protein RRG08_041376 [Elysia crispata]|uniref:Carboxylic ester hydrolase n=1 Tax=Elysia crispata TaxID=231223 RepID=A0AAE0XS59_9GAST|nr:hypothetical protein RRG08_041376 [Elysia crispata]